MVDLSYHGYLHFTFEEHYCEAWNLYGAAADQQLLLTWLWCVGLTVSFAACVMVVVSQLILRPCMAPVTDDTLYLCAARCVH